MKIEPKTKIWIKFPKTKILLPVNPKEINITRSSSPDTFKIIGVGQIGIPQYPDLATIKFESFFPGTNESYTIDNAKKPKEYCTLFENAMNNASVCRIIIKRPKGNKLNLRCVIRQFDTVDKGGEPLDLTYKLTLQEYRSYKPEKVVLKKKKKKDTKKNVAVKVKQRAVDTPKLRVGAAVVANGPYYYTSYGNEPHGTANNLKTEVKRIVQGREYPILIGAYGWTKESNLQIKS